jgi:stress response protein SCP2
LGDYNISVGSNLKLIITLLVIHENDCKNLVFDLFWDFAIGPDYLDATCFYFNRNKQLVLPVLDYRNRSVVGASHSGDVMDKTKRLGHHTIEVTMADVPREVNVLVFALSAWTSPSVSSYPNPRLSIHDRSKPTVQLGEGYAPPTTNQSQAMVMCSFKRTSPTTWAAVAIGHPCSGNARNYSPLVSAIQSAACNAAFLGAYHS